MKFALCHELYENIDWSTQCGLMTKAGYKGIEVAPFTISNDLASVPASQLIAMKDEAARHGLEVIGLHWLLAKTTGLYLTSPEPDVQRRTAEYFRLLARVCRLLDGHLMVLGSPQQRNLLPGVSREQAVDCAVEVLRQAVPEFRAQNVVVCLEPLTPKETNFMNTCHDAMEIIQRIDDPSVMLHQDVKAMLGAESDSIPDLIHRYKNFSKHFHVNDSNLLGPGMGETDFHPILKALIEAQYKGWVSVEVFDYKPGAQHIAVQSIEYMQRVLKSLADRGVHE